MAEMPLADHAGEIAGVLSAPRRSSRTCRSVRPDRAACRDSGSSRRCPPDADKARSAAKRGSGSSGPCYRTGRSERPSSPGVDIRRVNLAAVTADIGVSHVVGKDDDDVGPRARHIRGIGSPGAAPDDDQRGDGPFHLVPLQGVVLATRSYCNLRVRKCEGG